MASPKTWTIVHFIEDNSVEAVPTKWINGTRCLWPLLTPEKLSTAIKKQDFNTHWPDSPVRVLRNATFGDYATARAKAKKAEEFSDLNSTDADEADDKTKKKTKRRIIKKSVLSSEEENWSDDDEPTVKKRKSLKPLPPPPLWVEVEEESESNIPFDVPAAEDSSINIYMDDYGSTEGLILPKTHEKSLKTNTEEKLVMEHTSKKSANGSTEALMSIKSIQENIKKTKFEKNTGKEPASAIGNTNCGCSSSAVLFNIQNILFDIKATVDNLAERNIIKPEESKINILKKSKINFPISSEEDLDAMERFLGEEENYSSLVSLFNNMGGRNVYEFIKRCIAPLLSNNVAIHYSYIGRKGKKPFNVLALSKAILESAETSKIAKNRKETEMNLSIWLRKATERKIREEAKAAKNISCI